MAGPRPAYGCKGAVGVGMAGTGAIAQFTDRVIDPRRLPMCAGPETVGVTRGAVGLVGRERPGHCLGVTRMAICASELAPMIARVVGRVHKTHGRPGTGIMATVALETGDEVSTGFAGRGCPVVATAARRSQVAVINRCRLPGNHAVAVTAIGCRLNMTGRFARRLNTIVTIAAPAGDTRVVERRGQPGICAVTTAAIGRRRHMARRLARRVGAIVAAAAIAGDPHMVERRRRPGVGGVAHTAVLGGRHMGR